MGSHAVHAARDSLAVRHDLRPKAFSLGILSIGYAQIREIDKACATAHTLINLAERVPSRRLLLRVAEVLQALGPYRNQSPAADVFDSARAALRDSTH